MTNIRLVSLKICWILIIIFVLSVLSFAEIQSQTNAEAEQHYENANELYKIADYDAAITEFEQVIEVAPKSAIAQNAKYWIGQLYFETRQFDTALSTFEALIEEFPTSLVVPTTNLMIESVQQAKKNRALFEAITKGDIEQVKSLITEGADIDAKWGDTCTKEEQEKAKAEDVDSTPLCFAVGSNNMDVIKLLVEAGADVNAGSWSPLCNAIDYNDIVIAEYLIDHGANVNYPKDWGPLLEAIHIGNLEMINLLIEKGADINAAEYSTALIEAIPRNREVDKDIVELLIQHGADVNINAEWGYSPLYYAIHMDDPYFMNILIANGADVNSTYPGGETVLQSAAITGRTESVKLLLEAGADINAKNNKGQTALHLPLDIRNSNSNQYQLSKDTIEQLLNNGADVNLKDNSGRTPLHLAAESANSEIVELLLDSGAEVNAKDDESGSTALHYAALFGKKDVVELLIARGADINAKDNEDHTPLYVAVNHIYYEVAELLINEGADSSIEIESGQTLLQLTQEWKQLASTVPDMIFDGEPNDLFGLRMACGDIDGDGFDDILIGETRYNNRRGRVYLFYGGPDMKTTADLILEGQNEGDVFGDGITCGDIDDDGYDDIIIGAAYYNERQGRAYLYWGSDRNSIDANPDKIFTGEEERSYFGMGYPTVYDIDNDGYDDIILGSYGYPGNGTGRAYLYYGNAKELMDTIADLTFTGENRGDQHGFRIACGDVDNDSYGDIVISSHTYSGSNGRAYLYYGGSQTNMDAKADIIFEAKTEGRDYFGIGIVCYDQNRDGFDDIVIGAPYSNFNQGRAYIFIGNSKENLDTDPDMIFDGEGGFGICGDIDGDDVNDLAIGVGGAGQRSGRVYVYWGNELSDTDPKPGRIFNGEGIDDRFGYALACGDVNNDGFDDIIIGADRYKKDGVAQGRVYLYYGGPR